MLLPLAAAAFLTGSSTDGDGSAVAFMSGSGASGNTTIGSSPGCQRSMPSAEAPSDVLPKNRLAVFTEKPSCDGAGSSVTAAASGAILRLSSGLASDDIEASYWTSGGALRAACNSGSSET